MLDPSYIPQLSEIATCAGESAYPELWDGLSGAWCPLLGEFGSVLPDLSGGGLHAVLTNVVFGMDALGPVASFNGSTSFGTILTTRLLFADTTFTVSGTFKTSLGSNQFILDNGDGLASWIIGVGFNNPNTLTVALKTTSGSQSQRFSATAVNDGKLHHFMAVITTSTTVAAGNNVSIYIDGVLNQGSMSLDASPFRTNNGTLTIGKRVQTGATLTGAIGSLLIHAGALSPDAAVVLAADPFALYRRRRRARVSAGSAITALAASE